MMYDPGTLYSDPILTQFSVGYSPPTFVGLRMLPEASVNTQSGRYRVFDRSNRVRFPSRREPGTVANEVRGGRWSEDTFKTVEHSLQAAVADEEQQQLQSQGGFADPVFGGALQLDPYEDALSLINNSLLLEHEIAVATLLKNTATYPAGHTVTLVAADQWDNYAGATSNPIEIIRAAILKVQSKIGVAPNRLLMGALGVSWLENHPDMVARFSNFNLTDPNAFQELTGFEGEMVLVGDDKYNDNDIQEATESLVEAWGKDVILAYVNPQLALNDLSFGKTFAQIYPDGSTRPTDRWREEGRKSDLTRVSWKWDLKITSSIAGYLIKDAFSSTAW
jgi:Phage major capsid protein E